jgi:exopolyphosphatase/guanosine-5'-triphosphate,3'-diphosphate pyrophosphatase
LALVTWTAQLFADETPADTRLRVAVCALSDIAWRDSPELRAEESFRRVLQFPFIGIDHAERVFVAAGIHFRYAGRADASSLSPSIGLLTPDARQRAQILGRAILLAYRLSGGVPALLAGARLRIQPNKVRLEVGAAARVPDSEVVADRLRLLASAVGARHSEIVVTDGRN